MTYQRHPICDSAFCQECRTGEGELLDFEHEIEEIIERPLTLEERRIVEPYFETAYDELYVAQLILAGPPSQTNYGAW